MVQKPKNLEKESKNLALEANLNYYLPLNPIGMKKIQELVLTPLGFKLIVIDALMPKNRVFVGSCGSTPLFLEYINNDIDDLGHINLITTITGYLNCGHYCVNSNINYDHLDRHFCKSACEKCVKNPPCDTSFDKIQCSKCLREFFGKACFDHNLLQMCGLKTHCDKCFMEVKKGHKCNVYKCNTCNEDYSSFSYRCFIKTLEAEKLEEENARNKFIVCYDIESTVDTRDDKGYLHKPCLLMANISCEKCWDNGSLKKKAPFCAACGVGHLEYWGFTCVEKFCF